MKRKLKTGLSLLLTVVLVIGMSVPVFAADPAGTAPKTNITIKNSKGEALYVKDANDAKKIKAYRILEVTTLKSGGKTTYGYNFPATEGYRDAFIQALVAAGLTEGEDNLETLKAMPDDKLIDMLASINQTEEDKTSENKGIPNTSQIRTFANKMAELIPNLEAKGTEAAQVDGDVKFVDIPQGYYIITDERDLTGKEDVARSIAALRVAGEDPITINLKDQVPTVEKYVKDTNNSKKSGEHREDYGLKAATYQSEDPIEFTLVGELPENLRNYNTYVYNFVDTLNENLEYQKDSVEVYVANEKYDKSKSAADNVAANNLVKLTKDYVVEDAHVAATHEFKVKFADLLKLEGIDEKVCKDGKLSHTNKIVVVYKAKIKKDAVGVKYDNKVYVEYSNDPKSGGTGKTEDKKVTVYSVKFVINKMDNAKPANPLAGADFTIYKWVVDEKGENGTWVDLSEKVRKDITETNGVKNVFTFNNLDEGIYKIAETTTPAGYSTIIPITFEITAKGLEDGSALSELTYAGVIPEGSTNGPQYKNFENGENLQESSITGEIVNKTRGELPSTGGIGTTLFYLIGGIAVVTAGVLYVTKRKVNSQDVE